MVSTGPSARQYLGSDSNAATEELPLELLHLELVKNVLKSPAGSPEKEKALSDLEHIGFNAGYRLIEKLTREYPKFKDELDLMKFVCKDFWMCVFKKQIDNLRTNHQGVYVLQVNQLLQSVFNLTCFLYYYLILKVNTREKKLIRYIIFVVIICKKVSIGCSKLLE